MVAGSGKSAGAWGRRLSPAWIGLACSVIALSMTATACADQRDESGTGSSASTAGSSDGRTGQDGQTSSRRRLKLHRVAGFNRPVEVKSAPGFPKLMFVVEQEGRVLVVRRGRKLARPFLDLRGPVQSGGERGLLSIAFPPDYRKSKRFYVYYTDSTGDIRVDEFRRRTAVRARRNSGRRVITIPHRKNANHNGGQLHFLGRNLYFGTGDGGGAGDSDGNAQNLRSLLGKMLRIDPRPQGGSPYSIPASNPFADVGPGRPEIFSWGLRNPFRWSFDLTRPKRPRMIIADVGQDRFEEINDVSVNRANGADFGWNAFEGFSEFDGGGARDSVKPELVLTHPKACSVIGGLVVEDRKLPALRGRYLFSDFCDNRIRSFRPGPGRSARARSTGLSVPQVSSFGANRRGSVYITSLEGGLYRLAQ